MCAYDSVQQCFERQKRKAKEKKDAIVPTDGDGTDGSKLDGGAASDAEPEPEPEPDGGDGKTVVTDSPLRGAAGKCARNLQLLVMSGF